jgi:pectin methylesterase-like acyl-CoA thioesterase
MSFNPIPGKPPVIPNSINVRTASIEKMTINNIVTSNMNMNGGVISKLGDPVNIDDATNKRYVDSKDISPTITNLDVDGTVITSVGTPIIATDAATKGYVDNVAGGSIEFLAIVQKIPGPGEFSTIESALASITTASDTERWTISVGPGTYDENEIVMKPYINVRGSTVGSTVIRPNVPNQYLFKMANSTELSFISLQGIDGSVSPGPGAGFSAVYCEDVGDFAQMHKVSIYNFDECINNFANLTDSIIYVEYVDVNGDFTYGVHNRSTDGFIANIVLEDYFSFPSTSVVKTAILNGGVGAKLQLTGSTLYGGPGMQGIVLRNGSSITVGSVLIQDFGSGGVISENTGDGQSLRLDGITFANCTPDFEILNTGSSGYFFGNSPRDNHTIIAGSPFFMAGEDSNLIRVAKTGGDYDTIKEAVDSITNSSGVNPYVVRVGPGIYAEDTITLKNGITVIGSNVLDTIIIPLVNTQTVVIGKSGAYLGNLNIANASGVGGIGFYYTGTGASNMVIIDCAFTNNNTNIKVEGTSSDTKLYVSRTLFNGNTAYGLRFDNTTLFEMAIALNLLIYQNINAVPICDYFIYASGNLNLTCQSTNSRMITPVVGTTAIYLTEGATASINSSIIDGFDIGFNVPVGSTVATTALINSVSNNNNLSYDVLVGSSNTIGYWNGTLIYGKSSIPIDSAFYIVGQEQINIKVSKSGGDFSSIAAAMDSITDSSDTKRYVLNIGPGIFTEPEIVMKKYVAILGSLRSTVIRPDSNTHHIIRGADYCAIDALVIEGSGFGYASIYLESPDGDTNTSLITRNIIFDGGDILCWAYSNTGQSNIINYTSRFDSDFRIGFMASNNNINNFRSSNTVIAAASVNVSGTIIEDVLLSDGTNCIVECNSINIKRSDAIEPLSNAIRITNNGHFRGIGVNVDGFGTGIKADNTGTGGNLVLVGTTFVNCTKDIDIQDPVLTGSISVSASRTKTFVNGTPPIAIFLTDPQNGGVVISGPFNYTKNNYNNNTDISDLIIDTPTMGLLRGGTISLQGTPLTITVSAGSGYLSIGTVPNDILSFHEWIDTDMILASNSNLYIYINSSDVFTSSASYPNTVENILIGKVSTYSDIIYIQKIPLNAEHYSNHLDLMLKDALGPVYASGSAVTEIATSRTLSVTAGIYFFTNRKYSPGGGSPVTFTSYYRSATAGIYTPNASQTEVPNDKYDDGTGILADVTGGQLFTKHLLLMFGGPSEEYLLVYGQEAFASQSLAIAGSLPLVPAFVSNSFVRVASLVMEQGVAGIDTILDERPRLGFVSSSVAGTVSVHANLSGLEVGNDHPQYLLANGVSSMTGDLNMASNNIINVGLFNGFDVSAHASRHTFNGADPLSPALTADIAELTDSVAFQGTNNTLIPRADHQHAHGNRGGGTLHAEVIAAGASGFMSGTDKTKLDGVATGATNTTPSDTVPINITKVAASAGISAEVARQDHKHDIFTEVASGLLTSSTNTEGIATSLARSDHTHEISTDVPVLITPDQAIAIGNSTFFARADHIHNIPTGVAVSLNANSTSATGAAETFSRSNHSHSIESGVPINQTIAAAVDTGTSTNFARSDHIHTFSTAVPITISTANTEGTSVSFARADHAHALSNPFQQVQSTTSQSRGTATLGIVTGASITTAVTGNYLITFNPSGITNDNNSDSTTTFQVFNNGVDIATARGNCFTSQNGPIHSSPCIITIARLTAGQNVTVQWSVSSSTTTLPRFEFNIVMLSA